MQENLSLLSAQFFQVCPCCVLSRAVGNGCW